jgi:hypothetical protein
MDSPTRQIAVRLPRDLIKALEKRAKNERRPLAAMIRLILQDEMARDARRRPSRHAVSVTP